MTASRLVTVFCDEPGCGEWWDAGVADTSSEARASLRYMGWRVGVKNLQGGASEDFCPKHSERKA